MAVGCKFEKLCNCGLTVSYADQIIHDQMIRGLVEPIIQEKALSHVKDGDSLKASVAFINTLEKAKRDMVTLAGPGGLNRQGAWPGKRTDDKAGGSQSKKTCWGSGVKGHRKWSASCPDEDKECLDCKRKGHLKSECKPRRDGKISEATEIEVADREEEVDGDLGLLSPGMDCGSFFSFESGVQQGRQSTQHPSPPLQHLSWDSIVGSWSLQDGNLCKLESSAPAQGHHVWVKSKNRWVASRMKPHPKLKVRTAVSKSDYKL